MPEQVFKCREKLNELEWEDTRAWDAQAAAVAYYEGLAQGDPEWNEPDGCEVEVRCPDGSFKRFAIYHDIHISFSASELT